MNVSELLQCAAGTQVVVVGPQDLERKTPLTRRTPMAPGKPLTPGKPLPRAPFPRTDTPGRDRARFQRSPASTGPAPETRRVVLERDGQLCVCCGGTLTGVVGYSLQHRVARGAGGRSGVIAMLLNQPPNLVSLCGSGTTGCHGWVEAHPVAAQARGLALPSWVLPASVPVSTWEGWFALSDELRFPTATPPEGHALSQPGVCRLEVP